MTAGEGEAGSHAGNGAGAQTGASGVGVEKKRRSWIPAEWAVRPTKVEPWPEPVNGKELLDEIAATVSRAVVLGQWVLEVITLWIVHTYAYELREVVTYLGIESPHHRCGKSTLLDLMGRLVNRPLRAANISTPAFFRAIAETRPALLIDEADTFLHNEELRGILNSGYQREGAFVMRVTNELSSSGTETGGNGDSGDNGNGPGNGGPSRLVNFSSWCPKAIARIGRLPQTLADRCIVFAMQRKLPTERRARLKELELAPLRRKIARFVADHAEEIGKAEPLIPEGLNDRASDIWEPLLAIAELCEWGERGRQAALGLSGQAQENDPAGSLLMDILELFLKSGQERIFTRTMAAWLDKWGDRPWRAQMKRKGVTGQWLAQQLQQYGIRPKTLRIGEERAKGYEFEDFREAFRRYIPRRDLEAFRKDILEQAQERQGATARGSGAANQ